MAKTIEFNTGRLYTQEGQFIKATEHDDGHITFMDHSRGIDGELPVGFMLSQRDVMDGYDHNMHKSTDRSRQDGLYKGGCNTR